MKHKIVLTLLTMIYVMSCSEEEDPNGGVLNEYDEEDWLDPFDLTPLRKQKVMMEPKLREHTSAKHIQNGNEEKDFLNYEELKKQLVKCLEETGVEEKLCRQKLKQLEANEVLNTPSNAYLKHLIRHILLNIKPLNNDESSMHLVISKKNKEKLEARLNEEALDANKLMDFALDSFQTSEFISEKLIENVDKFSRGVLCIWSATNLLWSLLILFRRLFSFRSWNLFFIVILVLCFLISVPWNWYRMYKEKLALKSASLLMSIPRECNPESLTTFGSIKLWLKDTFSTADNACVKYHKNILVDPFWEVSPLSAFLVSASTLVGEPLKYFFHILGKSYRNLLAETPLLWQPVVFLVPLIIGMLIVLLYFGMEIKTILFTIGFGNNRRDHIRHLEDKIQDLKTENNELENRLRIRNENPIAVEDLPQRGLEGVAQEGNLQSRLNRIRIESASEAREGSLDDQIAFQDDIAQRHGSSPQDVSISTSGITRLPGIVPSSSSNPGVDRRSNSLDPENVTSEPSRIIAEPVEHEECLFERRESNSLDRELLSENSGVQEVRSNAANISHEVSQNDSFPSMNITTSNDFEICDPE